MADNNTKITKGITIKENSLTPKEIEIIPGGTADTKTTVQGSQTVDRTLTLPDATDTLVGKATTDTLTNKTIDANGTGNSISNLEVADLASGVLNVSTTLAGASDLQLPSALAVKTYVDDGLAAQDAASEISYDNTSSGLVATNVQDAIDEVESRVDTTEADIFNHITNGSGAHASSAISYNNVTSGLIATEVQSAIDELDGLVDTNTTGLSNHLSDATDAHDASAISNVPTGNLVATDVQGALDELQTDVDSRALATDLSNHISDTTTHGTTGDIVGTSDTQVLTNKDIDGGTASNTSRITLPKASKATLDSLTRKEGTVVYASDLDKVYYDDGSTLQEVGSGSGSGVLNFITNGDAEADTTGFALYKDAAQPRPVDGTGGTALNTFFTRSTSNPLSGVASFLLSKGSFNAQGEGVSYDFTIDNARKAKVLKVEFDYIDLTGGFVAGSSTTDSSIIVYLYDVTNSRLIEPSTFKLYSSSTTIPDKYQGYFQTSSNSTSYRLIFHIASTSATGFDLKIDNISVSPSQYVYGTPITDWAVDSRFAFTGFGPSPVVNVTSRRVGDSLQAKGNITVTSTASGLGVEQFTISGVSINTNKMPADGSFNLQPAGTAWYFNAGATSFLGVLYYDANNAVYRFRPEGGSASSWTASTSAGVPSNTAAGDCIKFELTIPVAGWSSSVQMSDSVTWTDDVGQIVPFAKTATPASVTDAPTGYLYADGSEVSRATYSDLFSKIGTAYGAGNGSTTFNLPNLKGIFVRGAGSQTFGSETYSGTAGTKQNDATAKNGLAISDPGHTHNLTNRNAGIPGPGSGTAAGTAASGGTTDVSWGYTGISLGAGDAETRPANMALHYFIKYARTAAPTISATETVSALYTGAPPTGTLSAALNLVTYGTKVNDTHGAYSGGIYTIPQSGSYDIAAQFYVNYTSVGPGTTTAVSIFIDGVERYSNNVAYETTALVAAIPQVVVFSIPLIAGQQVSIRSFANGTGPSFLNLAEYNRFSIALRK